MNFQLVICTYSTAAMKPESSSCASVPVSKRWPNGKLGAGRTLYGRQLSSSSRRPSATPEVRAVELVRRAEQHVDRDLLQVDRPVRRVVHGVAPGERAGLVRDRDDLLDGRDRAERVRGPRERDDARALGDAASAAGRGRAGPRRRSRTRWTVMPLSCASSSHGEMFASWSSFVATTSSPGAPLARRPCA